MKKKTCMCGLEKNSPYNHSFSCPLHIEKKLTKKLIGMCAVDSGSLMIVDPCYVLNDEKTSVEINGLYQTGVDIMLKKKFGEVIYSGIGGKGIITTTFDGDGSYPVYAEIDQNGLPTKIIIDLCP